MASLREEFEKKWANNTQNQRPSLRQQLDMSPEQRDAYKKYEWQEIKRVREQEEAENLNQMYSNYANQYNSYLDQIKSFDQNAGGTLRAGTGGYYHSPETYTNIEKQLGQLKQTGEKLDVPWAMIDYTDPKGVSGLPAPAELTRYVADMTDLAESQRDYYGQYKSPGQYYSRPMVPEVTQREPEGPNNPDWRQDYLKPDAKLPEGTQSIARGGKFGSDVKYTNWTQPQLSDDEQKAQLARGEEYSQYASGVPDNAKPAWQVTGTAGISLYKPDAFMEREIAYKKWKDNENSPYKTPVYVDVLKSSGQWETMPAAQRITAMKLGYQDEAKKYGKQIDGLGLRDRDGRVAEITYTLDYESLTPEKQRALEEERTALLSGDLEETYSDLEFRRAGAEKLAKQYETIEGWQKFDQKYQYVWNNADFVSLSGYDANKLKPGNPASQYYEYFNAGPERKRELESAITVPVLSLSNFMSPTVMESKIRLKGIDELDADEILVFNYLYNKKGADAAMEYLDGKGTELLSRRALTRQQRMEEMTENNLEFASLATLYWQMENAVTGPVQFVAGMLGTDPNDPIFDRQSDVVTVRSKAGQVLDQVYGNAMIPILNVPVASTLYNAGMSAGDSLLGRALGAVVGYKGLNRLMMTSRVLGSEMQNSLKKGDSIGMSVFRGLAAAIIENVTESLGDKAFYGNPRNVALYLAQNFFAEGSEEFLANLGNTMVEFAAKGTESEIYQKALDAAHKRAWSRETAQSFAFKEWLREAGTDFLTGSLMGLMSSVAGAPGQQSRVNQVKTNEAYDAIMADEGIKYSPKDKASLWMGELLQGDTPTTIESVLAPTNTRTEGYERAENADKTASDLLAETKARLNAARQGEVSSQLAQWAALDQENAQAEARKPASPGPDASRKLPSQSDIQTQQARQSQLDQAVADKEAAIRRRDEAVRRLNQTRQNIAGMQLANAAKLDAQVMQDMESRLADLQAIPDDQMGGAEVGQELDRVEQQLQQLNQELAGLDERQGAKEKPGPDPYEAEKQREQQAQLDSEDAALDARKPTKLGPPATETIDAFQAELDTVDINAPDVMEKIAEIQKRMDMAGIKRAEKAQVPYQGRDISYKRENIPDIQEHRAKNPELNDEAFDFAAEAAYGAGLSGSKTLFEVSAAIKDLAPETAKALFDAGLGVYNAKAGERHALRQRMKDYMPKPGQGKLIIPKEVIQKMNPEQKKLAADLQKFIIMVGVEGDLFASETADESGRILSEEGSFDPATGRFRFDINAGINFVAELKNKDRGAVEFALPRVMGHEFTHYLKTTAPELYAVYQDAIFTELAKKESVDDLVMQELGRARKGALTYDVALEEVVARASEMMLRDSEALPAVMAENPTLWDKFKAWVSEFVNNIRERMKGMNPAYAGAKSLIEAGNGIVKYAGNLQTLWDRAMADSIRYRMDAPGLRKTAPISPVTQGEGVTLASLSDGQKAANIAGNEGAARAGGETKYQERDSEGNQLSKEQQEYFKDSKARDSRGRLLVLYHGTSHEFYTFDEGKLGNKTGAPSSRLGFFFSDSLETAEDYQTPQSGDFTDVNDYKDVWKEANAVTDEFERAAFEKGKAFEENYWNIDVIAKTLKTYDSELSSTLSDLGAFELSFEVKPYIEASVNERQEVNRKAHDISDHIAKHYAEGNLYMRQAKEYLVERVFRRAMTRFGQLRGVTTPRTIRAYLNIQNMFTATGAYSKDEDKTRIIKRARKRGYDGVLFRDMMDGGNKSDHYVVFEPNKIKAVDNTTPTSSLDIRYQERDADYLAAVESGDMETAQKLVDEAAREAGYTVKAYHGTDADFTVFDTDEESTQRKGGVWDAEYLDGTIFMASDKKSAKYYGKNVHELYVKTDGMKKFKAPDGYTAARALDDIFGYEPLNHHIIRVRGYDQDIYATLDNTLMKKADPVTYDDAGNPIPLSERFKDSSQDIRYSSRLSPAEKRKLDADYMAAVKAGDMETAQRMVNDYAAARGYDADNDFRMTHEAPTNDGYNKPIYDMTAIYPSDFYEKGVEYYGSYTERGLDYEALSKLRKVRGNPDARLWIYRAVPADVKGDHFRNGDWVTITRGYAQLHGRDNIEGAYRVIEKRVPAKHIYTDANSIQEYGYDDGQSYAYANTKNNAKLLDAVTYDRHGSVIPLSKRFDKRNYDIRYSARPQLAPPLYSKMAQEIEAYKGDKMGADSVIAYLRGKGVKADEIRWSGIQTFLQGKKSVTKDELAAFAKGNELRVRESELGTVKTDEINTAIQKTAADLRGEIANIARDNEISMAHISMANIMGVIRGDGEAESLSNDEQFILKRISKELQDPYTVASNAVYDNEKPRYENYKLDNGTNYREVLFTAPDLDGTFQSAHWDEKNVLAHARLQDFTTTDGKPVLFIEEVQSDWHEKGREQGYVENIDDSEYGKYELYRVGGQYKLVPKDSAISIAKEKSEAELRERFGDMWVRNTKKNLLDTLHNNKNKVPFAPFAATWHEYVLKRVLRMAAEGDYDYVAWTTGEMQADRYDLAKQIGSVRVSEMGNQDGVFWVAVSDPGGNYLAGFPNDHMTKAEIVEMFGKDLGTRMINGAVDAEGEEFEISGNGLSIGGTGMKAFYDIGGKSSQNIPRFLNKYAGQWGAKVQTIKMDKHTVPAVEVTEKMRESVLYEGQPMYSERDSTGTVLSPQQVEYFKDSKVRDEQGRLLKVYHGTKADFTTFRATDGAYFTASKKVADGFAGGAGSGAYYLDFKTPLVLDAEGNRWDALTAPAEMGRSNAKYKMTPDEEAQYTEFRKLHEALQKLVDDGLSTNDYTKWHENNPRHWELQPSVTKIIQKQAAYEESNSSVIGAEDLVEWAKEQGKYDGVIIKNVREGWALETVSDDYIALRSEQVKRVDNLSPTTNPDIRYAERDHDNSLPSARAILAGAFGQVAQTTAEKENVEKYRKNADRYNRLENELNNLLEKRKQLYRDKAPQSEKNELRADINALRDKLDKADRVLLNLQMSKPLRDVVDREVDKAYQSQNAKSRERQKEYRERVRLRSKEQLAQWKDKYKQKESDRKRRTQAKDSIQKLSSDLREAVVTPTAKKHVPESMRGVIGEFLKILNEQSRRSLGGGMDTRADRAFYDKMDALVKAINNIRRMQYQASMDEGGGNEGITGHLDIPDDIALEMEQLVQQVKDIIDAGEGEYVINRMNLEQLESLDKMLRVINSAVRKANALHNVPGYKQTTDLAGATHTFLGNMKSKLHRIGKSDRFLNWSNTEPIYALDRLGPAGKAIAAALIKGMDTQAKNSKRVLDFALETFTEKESREWGKTLHHFTLDGQPVVMNTAQLMSLYLLNKRDQARGHLYGGGFRVETFKVNGKNYADGGHVLLERDVAMMLKELAPDQKKKADALQEFMSTVGAEWGNTVSMARWGFNYFNEENYFPIESARENIEERLESAEGNPLYRLLNLGHTKGLIKGANNQIMLRNVVDVFAAHMSDMAQYNALAMPLLDAIKWYNYQESKKDHETGRKWVTSVRKDMMWAFGDAAPAYMYRLLSDISGARMTGFSGAETYGLTALRRYNRAMVAANLRVAVLQPTAFLRAHNVINARHLTLGALKNVVQLRKNIREMEKWSGIAIWKQMGFYDINLSRSLLEMIKRDNPLIDRMTEASMNLPQAMDRITWAAIWGAAKNQVAANNPGLDRNSDAFYKKVQELFDDAIYRTQVVDSMLTRSEHMRETNLVSKWTSSFMSEPTKTYNILAGQVHAFTDDIAGGMTRGQAWAKNRAKIGRTMMTYGITVALTSAVEALMGAWRDDDDYKTFWEKFLAELKSNALDNLIPLNWLPIVNDVWQLAKDFLGRSFGVDLWGYEEKSILTAGIQMLFDGTSRIISYIKKPEGKYFYGATYELLRGVSAISGHPLAAATREVVDLWNNTAGLIYPEYQIKRFPPAVGDGYDKIYEAMVAGDKEAEKRYRDTVIRNYKGSGDIEKNIGKGLGERIKADYLGGTIGLEEMLTRKAEWAGYTDAQEDIRDAFKAGTIDRKEAERLLKEYAGDKEPKEMFKLLERWETEDEAPDKDGDGTPDFSILDKFYTAVRTGKNLRAVVTEYTDPNKYAYDSKYLAGQITTAFKQEYIDNPAQRSKLKGYLLNAYTLLGYDREERSGEINRWLMKYDSADFENAIATGVNLKAVIDEKIKYSTAKNPKGVIISQVTATFADQYKKMSPGERARIKPRLIDAYVMLGYDRAYSSKKIDKWLTD